MSRKKEKVKFFERVVIEDVSYAEEVYERESKRFKISLICTAVAALGTLLFNVGQTSDALKLLLWGVFGWATVLFYGEGLIGTILTGPKNVLKLIWKVGLFGYWIVPFFGIDLLGFVFSISAALIVLVFYPVVFSLYNLYQSYTNMKDAEDFLNTCKMFNTCSEC